MTRLEQLMALACRVDEEHAREIAERDEHIDRLRAEVGKLRRQLEDAEDNVRQSNALRHEAVSRLLAAGVEWP